MGRILDRWKKRVGGVRRYAKKGQTVLGYGSLIADFAGNQHKNKTLKKVGRVLAGGEALLGGVGDVLSKETLGEAFREAGTQLEGTKVPPKITSGLSKAGQVIEDAGTIFSKVGGVLGGDYSTGCRHGGYPCPEKGPHVHVNTDHGFRGPGAQMTPLDHTRPIRPNDEYAAPSNPPFPTNGFL